jgi:hypothetical protein
MFQIADRRLLIADFGCARAVVGSMQGPFLGGQAPRDYGHDTRFIGKSMPRSLPFIFPSIRAVIDPSGCSR